MATCCSLCQLLQIQTNGEQEIDDEIKSIARCQLSQIEGSDLTVNEFMENRTPSPEENKNELLLNEEKPRLYGHIHQPFLDYCKQIFRNHPGDTVQCKICGKNIAVRDRRKTLIVRNTISHACIHLGKRIFACVQCDKEFTCIGSISSHLLKDHKLSTHPGNYLDSSAKFEKEILELLKICYDKAGSGTVISGKITRRRSFRQLINDPLSNMCRGLFANLPLDANVRCSLCGAEKKLYSHQHNRPPSIESIRFITHALVHLAKPIFKCLICDRSTLTRWAMDGHLSTHKLAKSKVNFVDESNKYQKEIIAMLEKCFDQASMDVPVSGSPKPMKGSRFTTNIRSRAGPDTLLAERKLRCYEMIQKFKKNGKIKCRLCLMEVRCNGTQMLHVLSHQNRVLYHCRLCTHTSASRTGMQTHMRLTHGHSNKKQYEDKSNDFHAELLKQISDCFDWDQGAANAHPKEDNRAIRQIIGQSHGNSLKADRLLRCRRLAQKFARDGRLSCRICSASIGATKNRNTYCSHFLDHAMTHLKKIHRFKCKQCPETAYLRITMVKHLKTAHSSTDKTDCEDRSDMFHTKIMEILTKCYDWELKN